MNKQSLKTTLATVFLIVGGLISACANSGGQYGTTPARQSSGTETVKVLSPKVEEELTFSDSELAVVFAVDKKGRLQAFTTEGNKVAPKDLPLRAGNIDQMDTITTFKTSNPKSCWLSHGSLVCVEW